MKKAKKAEDYIPQLMARCVIEVESGKCLTCLSDRSAAELAGSMKYRRATAAELMPSAESMLEEGFPLRNPDPVFEPEVVTPTKARKIMALTREQTLTFVESGETLRYRTSQNEAEVEEQIKSGQLRKPTKAELRAELEEQGGDQRDKLAAIEGMLGGLAALRIVAEHGEGWIGDGMEMALLPHFNEIERILDAGRKAYAANVRNMKKAIA